MIFSFFKYSLFNQFGHYRCRHRLEMGEQTSPPQVNIFVKFFCKGILNSLIITLIRILNRSSYRRVFSAIFSGCKIKKTWCAGFERMTLRVLLSIINEKIFEDNTELLV